jgi:Uma2 family endonuclease
MALEQRRQLITAEQYLAQERLAETKSEYLGGEVFAMAGASRQHNKIVVNILNALGPQLRRRPCDLYPSDMRVKVAATGLYTYPDVSVVCGELQFEDAEVDTLLNPMVIIEVLSKSTAAYDRGEKFEQYRKIPSLNEYLLIAQERCLAEHYVRQPDGRWLLSEANDLQDVIELQSIGCRLALADVYEDVLVLVK